MYFLSNLENQFNIKPKLLKKVQIDGLGEVTLKKSAQAKYIKLRVEPFKGIVVTVPTYLNYEFGLNAIMGKYAWLENQLKLAREKENDLKYTENDFPLFSKNYRIELKKSEIQNPKRFFKNGVIFIIIPNLCNIYDLPIQEYISVSVNKVLRADAKVYLTKRVHHYAEKHQLNVKKITIRDTKTRWGSCSYQNNISLSFHLMKLPDSLIDYVVLHELAHTKEKNHQKPFWDLLEVFCEGKAKILDKELKKYNHLILR